jgi:hypothetical protein
VGKRFWASLAVLALLAVVLSSCGGEETTPPGQPPGVTETTAPSGLSTPGVAPTEGIPEPARVKEGNAEMVVDAASGGEVTATAEVSGSAPFQVDVDIRGATVGYQGYQYYLEWDPKILAFDGHEDVKPAGLDLCANPTRFDSTVAAGCVNTTEATTFAGAVGTLTFHCVSGGTSPLHLVSEGESPNSFSTALAPRGLVIPTNLMDASVTCLGG